MNMSVINGWKRCGVAALLLGLLAMGLLNNSTAAAQEKDPNGPPIVEKLTIGSKAPKLDIEHWVQDGNGKLGPVEKFEDGKVYVVEFWATWCGPCIASMPHISELQQKYRDKGVTVISISDEDLETVEGFLKREVAGEEGKTYADLTQYYCLTTDPDRSSHDAYMKAAGQNGIPTAFIVGKDGVIEWIGHPMTMDEPLEKVIEGSWDREEAIAQMKVEAEMESAMAKIGGLVQGGKFEEARELVKGMMEKSDNEVLKANLSNIMMAIDFNELNMSVLSGKNGTVDLMNKLTENFKEEPQALNQMAWLVVQVADSGRDVSEEMVAAAMKAIDAAVTQEPNDASILDTKAHLLAMQGVLDEAIEIQKKAIENSPPETLEDLKAYLKELEAKKDKQ